METLDINQLSAAAGIITFLLVILCKYRKQQKIILADLVFSALAGGMLPLAFCLSIYPFFPNWLGDLEKMSLQITIIGLTLLYLYLNAIFRNINSDTSKTD